MTITLPDPNIRSYNDLLRFWGGGQPEELNTRDLIKTIYDRDAVMFTPSEFGADPTGRNSSTDELATALSQVPDYGRLIIPSGRYTIDGSGVSMARGNIAIDGSDSAIIDASSMTSGSPLTFAGTLGASTTCAHDIAIGDTTITVVDASIFTAGDIAKFTTTEYDVGDEGISGFALTTKGEFIEIIHISGNDLTINKGMKDDYTLTAPGLNSPSNNIQTVAKVNWLDDIMIRGVKWKGSANGQNYLGGGVPQTVSGPSFRYCRYPGFHDNKSRDFSSFALKFNHCIGISVQGNHGLGQDLATASNLGPTLSPWFYYINLLGCQGINFIGNVGHRHRHFMDGGGGGDGLTVLTRGINCIGNLADNCGGPFVCHQARDGLFMANTTIGGGGFNFRGRNVAFIGNRASFVIGWMIVIGGASFMSYEDTDRVANGDVLIKDNVVNWASGVVNVRGDCTSLTVEGNVGTNLSDMGGFTTSRRITRQIWKGNTFVGSRRDTGATVVGLYDRNMSGGGTTATVTITIASPAVITWTAHGMTAGTRVKFTTTGALPTGITAGDQYYVISAGLATDSFRIAATIGGAAINTSGSQSGVHTGNHGFKVGAAIERGSSIFKDNTIEDYDYGIVLEGVGSRTDNDTGNQATPADNIELASNHFKNIDEANIRLGIVDGERGWYGENVTIHDNHWSRAESLALEFDFGFNYRALPSVYNNKEPDHHPRPGMLSAQIPSNLTGSDAPQYLGGTMKIGQTFYRDPPAVGQPLGWVCTVVGSTDTQPKTGSISIGTNTITFTATCNFTPGTYINVPGAGPAAATKKFRVVSIAVDSLSVTVDSNADTTASGVSIDFAPPTFGAMANLA